jgi:hypothetical protein
MREENLFVQPARIVQIHQRKNSASKTIVDDKVYGYGESESSASSANGIMTMSATAGTGGITLSNGTTGISTMGIVFPPIGDIPGVDIPGIEIPAGYSGSWSGGLPMTIVIRKPKINPVNLSDFKIIPKTTDFIYDRYGNLLQKKENGIYYSYLWGYNRLYKIAEIANTPLEEVLQKLGITEDTLLNAGLTAEQERLLRELPEALITTYKYKPFVGIIEQTDVSGKKVFYEYYPGGKLKTIRDDKQRIVQSFDYSIK